MSRRSGTGGSHRRTSLRTEARRLLHWLGEAGGGSVRHRARLGVDEPHSVCRPYRHRSEPTSLRVRSRPPVQMNASSLSRHASLLGSWYGDKPATGFSVTIEVALRCNVRCVFCSRWSDPTNLDLGIIGDIAEDMAELGAGYVSLSGGDPFVRSDIEEIHRQVRRALGAGAHQHQRRCSSSATPISCASERAP